MYRVREQILTGKPILQECVGGVWRDVTGGLSLGEFHIVTEREAMLDAAQLAHYKREATQNQVELAALRERVARYERRAAAARKSRAERAKPANQPLEQP